MHSSIAAKFTCSLCIEAGYQQDGRYSSCSTELMQVAGRELMAERVAVTIYLQLSL